MALVPTSATKFGAPKYAALHLLLASWIRRFPLSAEYVYVTLGGTELRDVQSLLFIDPDLIRRVISFETDPQRYKMACASRDRMVAPHPPVEILPYDIFDYVREMDDPHLFFIDLPGIFDIRYREPFTKMLRNRVIREGDALLITSYLVDRRGYGKAFEAFRSEFVALGADSPDQKHSYYTIAHPFFTLRRGVVDAGLVGEMSVIPIGFIEYKDTSRMGIYAYAVRQGATQFESLVTSIPRLSIS